MNDKKMFGKLIMKVKFLYNSLVVCNNVYSVLTLYYYSLFEMVFPLMSFHFVP